MTERDLKDLKGGFAAAATQRQAADHIEALNNLMRLGSPERNSR